MVDKVVGFELGWDHARHSVEPAPEHLNPGDALYQGYEAGRASFGARARTATPAARRWLSLRLQAWLRGRSFELMGVTPNYLQQLQVSHCPVTRAALTEGAHQPPLGAPSDAIISRVCEDAGYACGNLAVLSLAADLAKLDVDHAEAFQIAQALESTGTELRDGLDAAAWRRLGVLQSFVTPLSQAEAARVPLLMLPPNRLHLLNPIQALQALATRLAAGEHAAAQLQTLARLLPAAAATERFAQLAEDLQTKLAGARQAQPERPATHTLEDLWCNASLQGQWQQFASLLSVEQTESVLEQATAHALLKQRVVVHSAEQSTAGWALETRGYAVERPASVRPRAVVALDRLGRPGRELAPQSRPHAAPQLDRWSSARAA